MGMEFSRAQADVRAGYCSGGTGILASALAWSAAAATVWLASPMQGVWALLIGGALIHPVGLLLCRLLGASGRHARGNPLGLLAGASTFWLIFSLPLAYGLALQRVEWFFPAMLLVIGGRYLVFATLYGLRLYWALGLALAGAGVVLGVMLAPPALSAAVGASTEFVFAVACLIGHRRRSGTEAAGDNAPEAGAA